MKGQDFPTWEHKTLILACLLSFSSWHRFVSLDGKLGKLDVYLIWIGRLTFVKIEWEIVPSTVLWVCLLLQWCWDGTVRGGFLKKIKKIERELLRALGCKNLDKAVPQPGGSPFAKHLSTGPGPRDMHGPDRPPTVWGTHVVTEPSSAQC